MSTYNAYYAAFLLEHGYRSREEAHEASFSQLGHRNLAYIAWICARCREFEGFAGIKPEARAFHRDQFTAWLAARSVDHQARAHVEAA